MGGWRRLSRSRSLLAAVALTSLAGIALGATAMRSALAREDAYRTGYASTAALVRDRLLADVSRHESALAADLAIERVPADVRAARAWLGRTTRRYPWLEHSFLVRTDGGILTSDLALEWPSPADSGGTPPAVAALLHAGERAELATGDLARAARLYQEALRAAPGGWAQALARMRAGRVLFKLRRYDAGIQHYRDVLASHAELLDPTGVPFGIGALDQIAAGFDALGRTGDRDAALRDLREAVIQRPWDVDHGYGYYVKRAFAGASQPDPRADRLERRLGAIRWLEAEVAPRFRSDPGGASGARVVVEGEGGPAILGWRPVGSSGVAGMAFGYQIRAAYVAGPLLAGVLHTVDVGRDVLIEVRDSGAPDGALAAAPLFDWTVVLLHRDGYSLAQLVARERWTYGTLVGGMMAVLAIGLTLAMRATAREAELARLRTEFVANVSHELKTPLALIRMYGETLDSGLVEKSSERREFSGVIRRESERLTHLINNVLDTARIEAGTKEYRLAPADLAALTRQALDAYHPFLTHLGFAVDTRIPDGPIMLSLDADAIVQALLNLLHNAVKYSDERRRLTVSLTGDEGAVRLALTDEGIGLAAAEIPRVFEKYYRVRTGAAHARTGSGLGLSIVAHAMAAHGGRVDVESAVGQGSTFTLIFPAEMSCPAS